MQFKLSFEYTSWSILRSNYMYMCKLAKLVELKKRKFTNNKIIGDSNDDGRLTYFNISTLRG